MLSPAARFGNLSAVVHSSRNGMVLSRIRVPGPFSILPAIAADGSDRSSLITRTRKAAMGARALLPCTGCGSRPMAGRRSWPGCR
jgi:hypothetical protein